MTMSAGVACGMAVGEGNTITETSEMARLWSDETERVRQHHLSVPHELEGPTTFPGVQSTSAPGGWRGERR